MKLTPLLAGIAAALLFSATQSAHAGILTIENGPSFLPSSSFTDNSIAARRFHNPGGLNGDVVRLFGDSEVTPTGETPRIRIGGNFEANAGDVFTVSYDLLINLKTSEPITLTLGARTHSSGVTDTFTTTITINPGPGRYQGTVTGVTFDLATSGTWKGRLFFNFLSSTSGSTTDYQTPERLLIKIRAVDFELVSVPEPSSLVCFGLGLAALGGFALRRRQLA